jgi:hypothetical protein
VKLTCPTCAERDSINFNMETDVACCDHCGELFPLSRLVAESQQREDFVNLPDPPQGVVFSTHRDGWAIAASTRDTANAAHLLLPVLFFLGPSVCFAWQAIAQWTMNVGAFLFLAAWSTVGLATLWCCLMNVFGHVAIRNDGGKGSVFTGIGFVGLTKRFAWKDVVGIAEETPYQHQGYMAKKIVLVGVGKSFGQMIPTFRIDWVAAMLQRIVAAENPQAAE